MKRPKFERTQIAYIVNCLLVEDEEPLENASKVILNEPPFDSPYLTDWQEKINLGYCGYGLNLTHDVTNIRDVRMLVNYFMYLLTNECKNNYERGGRDYLLSVKRATRSLISTIINSIHCREIPVLYGKDDELDTAIAAAKWIESTSQDQRYLSDRIESVRDLASQLQFYFYGHIDDFAEMKGLNTTL